MSDSCHVLTTYQLLISFVFTYKGSEPLGACLGDGENIHMQCLSSILLQ